MADKMNTQSPKNDKPAKVKKPSIFSRTAKWFRDLKSEAKKVVWPTRSQVTNNTLIVLSAVLLVGTFIWVLDFAFSVGYQALSSINLG